MLNICMKKGFLVFVFSFLSCTGKHIWPGASWILQNIRPFVSALSSVFVSVNMEKILNKRSVVSGL